MGKAEPRGNAFSFCDGALSRRRCARPNAAKARQGMQRGRERPWVNVDAGDVGFRVTPYGGAAILRVNKGRVCQ